VETKGLITVMIVIVSLPLTQPVSVKGRNKSHTCLTLRMMMIGMTRLDDDDTSSGKQVRGRGRE
jgi:hypothetical protein